MQFYIETFKQRFLTISLFVHVSWGLCSSYICDQIWAMQLSRPLAWSVPHKFGCCLSIFYQESPVFCGYNKLGVGFPWDSMFLVRPCTLLHALKHRYWIFTDLTLSKDIYQRLLESWNDLVRSSSVEHSLVSRCAVSFALISKLKGSFNFHCRESTGAEVRKILENPQPHGHCSNHTPAHTHTHTLARPHVVGDVSCITLLSHG